MADLRAYARAAATRAGIDPDTFERQILSLYVLPGTGSDRLMCGREADSVLIGERPLRDPSGCIAISHLNHLSILKLRLSVSIPSRRPLRVSPAPVPVPASHETEGHSVIELTPPSSPFQIIGTVICGVAVKVVDLMLGRWGMPQKGWCHQTVYWIRERLAPDGQDYMEASIFAQRRTKNLTDRGPAGGHYSPNASEVADFVPALKADHGAPLFGRGIMRMHRAYSSVPRPRLRQQRGGIRVRFERLLPGVIIP